MSTRHIIQAADGTRHIVEVPDQPTATAPQPEFQRAGGGPAWLSGVQDAVIKSGLGVKQMFGGLSDEQKAVLREMELEKEADPNGFQRGAGEILTNIGMVALPGAHAEKALRATRLLRGGGTLKNALAAGGAGGATEMLTSVGEGDSYTDQLKGKLKNAGQAAATGGALQGFLGVVAMPFKNTAEAQMLFDQGINPTLQQGAFGRVGRALGGLTSGVVDVRGRQEHEIADALLRRITDNNISKPSEIGKEVAADAQGYVQGLYDNVFQGKRFPASPRALGKTVAAAQRLNPQGQMRSEAKQAGAVVGNIIGPADANKVNRNISYEKLRDQYLNRLSSAASIEQNPEVRARILAARKELIDNVRNPRLSPDELARVHQIDVKNFDVNRLKEATAGAVGQDEGVTLRRLLNAYGDKSMPGNTTVDGLLGPARRVIGVTPDQSESRALLATARRVLKAGAGAGAVGLGAWAGLGVPVGAAYGLSALGQTAGGAKALMGQTAKQKALAELLHKYVGMGIIAPSVVNQEYEDGP